MTAAEKKLAKTTPNSLGNTKNELDGGLAQGHQNGLATEQGTITRNAPIGRYNPQEKKLNWAQISKLQRPV